MPSLSQFKSSFRNDLARQNKFAVFISIPQSIAKNNTQTTRTLAFRCEVAQLPGRTFATTEQKTYGPVEKHPYLTTYTDIDLTLIVEDKMEQKKLFDSWLDMVNPTSTNDFKYRRDYETAITINQYNVSGVLSYSATLYEAYPISMNQLDLDWSSEGYHKLVVTFAYTFWRSQYTPEILDMTPERERRVTSEAY